MQSFHQWIRWGLIALLISGFWGIWGESWARRYTPEEEENIRIYKEFGPGVVNITSITLNFDFFYQAIPTESGSGSGFLIDTEGHIVTNHHVIENSQKLVVTLSDNSQWPAKVVGADPNNDLAVIKIEAPSSRYQVLHFVDSAQLEVGQKVLALGNPFGLKQTLTTGIISALGRTIQARNGRKIEGVIQTDAAINPGNSGGPLLDTDGKVVGINSQIVGPSGGNIGIGFAIPSNTAKRILPDLLEVGYVRRPWLGVESIPTENLRKIGVEIETGMLIINLVRGGPADQAGLRGAKRQIVVGNYQIPWGGDIITHIDGDAINSFEDLAEKVESYKPGETVKVRIIRGNRPEELEVQLQQRPRPQEK